MTSSPSPTRRLVLAAGGLTLTLPLAGRAQQKAMPVIGCLLPNSPEGGERLLAPFRQGLSELGHVEGQNVAIEYRWALGHYDRLPALTADLITRRPAVIFSGPLNSTVAAKAGTSTIPIVFAVGVDPVAFGLVASLSRPGGNLTGVAIQFGELWPKRLQILHELVPNADAIGALINPDNRNAERDTRNLRDAATAIGVKVEVFPASNEHEIDSAFIAISERRLTTLLVGDDPFFGDQTQPLTALAARYRIPTIYQTSGFVTVGGLISYGPSLKAIYTIAGRYTGRILAGAKPADLPIQQPTKFDLVINLKTARALSLTVPQSLLASADEVIE